MSALFVLQLMLLSGWMAFLLNTLIGEGSKACIQIMTVKHNLKRASELKNEVTSENA